MSAKSAFSPAVEHIVKFKWTFTSVLIVALIGIYAFIRISSAIASLEYGLTPPTLPEYEDSPVEYVNPIGWPDTDSEWFHHASQGTATIPIPYQWLVALEQPKNNPWLVFFGSEGAYVGEYMLRLGFIKQAASKLNPDALPIGVAVTDSIYFPGIDRQASAAGFTCAACHTGQLLHEGTRYVIDGGPAMTDLGLLTRSLGAALGQTALSSQFSLFNGRFERFARNVLGSNDNILTRNQLKQDLTNTIKELVKTSDAINVTEGFTRLDALTRIGNQVFSADIQTTSNYSPIIAPVNFPHIWTTSWFDWVQYDGSIMQPLTRNTGEALGVKAFVDTTGPNEQRFASSVDINNLHKIENWMAGTHPLANKQFNGLRAPKWPAAFPAIDDALAEQGAQLYQRMCKGCHLPPIESDEFWTEKYWQPINYLQAGEQRQTAESYLKVKIIAQRKIGTDPAQGSVLTNRTVNTTGLSLNTEVCANATIDSELGGTRQALVYVPLNDSATSNFGLALGAFVERTNQQWFAQNYLPASEQPEYEGLRPNCLQVNQGYKARPLNGVWATAPFLHNGSVATLYDLLSAPEERPVFVELGDQTFDAKHVGIAQGETIAAMNAKATHESYKTTADYSDGRFILDTRQPGNHASGHAFVERSSSGKRVAGRIGRALAENEKLALIEYLKIL